MDERTLYIEDDNGNTIEAEILFTCENPDDSSRKYVVYHVPGESLSDFYVSLYDDEGNLYQLEDDAELEMVNEILEAFLEDEAEEE